MNAGGGKTVGVLVAQLQVNKMGKQVHYVIPAMPLIKQAVSIGSECGIEVAPYAGGSWYTPAISENGRKLVYFTRADGNVVTDHTHWQTGTCCTRWSGDLRHLSLTTGRPAVSDPRRFEPSSIE
jgi:hypothetical protein